MTSAILPPPTLDRREPHSRTRSCLERVYRLFLTADNCPSDNCSSSSRADQSAEPSIMEPRGRSNRRPSDSLHFPVIVVLFGEVADRRPQNRGGLFHLTPDLQPRGQTVFHAVPDVILPRTLLMAGHLRDQRPISHGPMRSCQREKAWSGLFSLLLRVPDQTSVEFQSNHENQNPPAPSVPEFGANIPLCCSLNSTYRKTVTVKKSG